MILVTGGTGLIGSHLLYYLLIKGEQVKATYRQERSIEKTKKVFNYYQAESLFERILWVEADVSDYFSLKDAFEGVSSVYHCAAVVSFDRRRVDRMYEVNIEGTRHMIDLSLATGIRKFCFVSSVASLGSYADGRCSDEDTLWEHTSSTSNYSISKYYAENEVWRGAEEGLNVVIVNPATVIGYGDWNESSTTIIKRVNEGLKYYPSGSNAFVGVKDVVKAMYHLMNANITNERYVLAAKNCSFKELLSQIALGLGKNPPRKKAPRWIANCLRRVDEVQYFLLGSKPVLTKQSVATAYEKRCYSAKKVKTDLQFEFENIDSVIAETSQLLGINFSENANTV